MDSLVRSVDWIAVCAFEDTANHAGRVTSPRIQSDGRVSRVNAHIHPRDQSGGGGQEGVGKDGDVPRPSIKLLASRRWVRSHRDARAGGINSASAAPSDKQVMASGWERS